MHFFCWTSDVKLKGSLATTCYISNDLRTLFIQSTGISCQISIGLIKTKKNNSEVFKGFEQQ
jgi:hypothetical protein